MGRLRLKLTLVCCISMVAGPRRRPLLGEAAGKLTALGPRIRLPVTCSASPAASLPCAWSAPVFRLMSALNKVGSQVASQGCGAGLSALLVMDVREILAWLVALSVITSLALMPVRHSCRSA